MSRSFSSLLFLYSHLPLCRFAWIACLMLHHPQAFPSQIASQDPDSTDPNYAFSCLKLDTEVLIQLLLRWSFMLFPILSKWVLSKPLLLWSQVSLGKLRNLIEKGRFNRSSLQGSLNLQEWLSSYQIQMIQTQYHLTSFI